MPSLFHVTHNEATWALGVLNTNTHHQHPIACHHGVSQPPIILPQSGICNQSILLLLKYVQMKITSFLQYWPSGHLTKIGIYFLGMLALKYIRYLYGNTCHIM